MESYSQNSSEIYQTLLILLHAEDAARLKHWLTDVQQCSHIGCMSRNWPSTLENRLKNIVKIANKRSCQKDCANFQPKLMILVQEPLQFGQIW